MTREEFIKRFPEASESTIRKNCFEQALVNQAEQVLGWTPPCLNLVSIRIEITIQGQIKGGKNNMIVTRTGLHFPKPEWAKWRNQAVEQVKAQLPAGWKPYSEPTNIRLDYFAGDKRRRDMPAIIDSIFHVFEKAEVVTDDTLLWVTESTRGYDKDNPRAVVTFL